LYAVQVMWDLGVNAEHSRASYEDLREYLRTKSIALFEGMEGVRQKVWVSNPETGRWRAMYLLDSKERQQAVLELAKTSAVTTQTGLQPASVETFEVEAVAEGVHTGIDLRTAGLAR